MQPSFKLRDYPIFLGPIRENFPAWIRQQAYSNVFVITDENVAGMTPGFPKETGVRVPAGEIHKTLASCEHIWSAMFAASLDRKALVVNLGGGVVGDMGGFCAATFKRGVDFVQIPTTLLSMTDAAIGGKLAIDFQGIKNSVGVFKNPVAVFADPVFLHTLPERELRSGFAEVIKHARIGDPFLWDTIRAQSGLPGFNWADILRLSIAVKVRIVEEDPLEQGLRTLLNFGHTIGHALESYFLETDSPLTHGEAIAIGMICEALPSAGQAVPNDLIDVIGRFFPHRAVPESAFPELWRLMQQDKKNASGAVRMAVPDAYPYSMKVLELTPEDMARRLLFYNQLL